MPLPTDWLSILAYTQDMLDAARAEQWSELETLQHQRHSMLQTYFASLDMELEPEKIASQIMMLRGLDKQIMKCCRNGQESVKNDLHNLHRGKKAGHAYLSHSR